MDLLCLYLSGKRFGSLSAGEDGRFWWLLTKETGDTRFSWFIEKGKNRGSPRRRPQFFYPRLDGAREMRVVSVRRLRRVSRVLPPELAEPA